MVYAPLIWLMLAAVPHGALLIVGDVDQLPAIGSGRELADIIASGVVAVAREARICCRQTER